MSEPIVVDIDEIEGAHGGVFKPVGGTLGVTAFGVNVKRYPGAPSTPTTTTPRTIRKRVLRDRGLGHSHGRRR